MATKNQILGQHARMWPRDVFYRIIPKEEHGQPKTGKRQQRLMFRTIELLKEPGVYVLYQDGVPYYILRSRGCTCFIRMACRTTSAKQRGYVVGCGDTLAYLTADITISGITSPHSSLETQTIEMRLKPSLLQPCQQRTVRSPESKKSRCLWALEK